MYLPLCSTRIFTRVEFLLSETRNPTKTDTKFVVFFCKIFPSAHLLPQSFKFSHFQVFQVPGGGGFPFCLCPTRNMYFLQVSNLLFLFALVPEARVSRQSRISPPAGCCFDEWKEQAQQYNNTRTGTWNAKSGKKKKPQKTNDHLLPKRNLLHLRRTPLRTQGVLDENGRRIEHLFQFYELISGTSEFAKLTRLKCKCVKAISKFLGRVFALGTVVLQRTHPVRSFPTSHCSPSHVQFHGTICLRYDTFNSRRHFFPFLPIFLLVSYNFTVSNIYSSATLLNSIFHLVIPIVTLPKCTSPSSTWRIWKNLPGPVSLVRSVSDLFRE